MDPKASAIGWALWSLHPNNKDLISTYGPGPHKVLVTKKANHDPRRVWLKFNGTSYGVLVEQLTPIADADAPANANGRCDCYACDSVLRFGRIIPQKSS